MKQPLEGVNSKSNDFIHMQEQFSNIMYAGYGLQLRKALKDDFEAKLRNIELATWCAFKSVIEGFFDFSKNEQYESLVDTL